VQACNPALPSPSWQVPGLDLAIQIYNACPKDAQRWLAMDNLIEYYRVRDIEQLTDDLVSISTYLNEQRNKEN
jgi:hypothetical protein